MSYMKSKTRILSLHKRKKEVFSEDSSATISRKN